MPGNSTRLGEHRLFASGDVDDVRDRVARVYCSHRLDPLPGSSTVRAWQNSARLSRLSVGLMSYGAGVAIDPGCLETFFLMMLPFSGQSVIDTGGQRFATDTRTAALLNPTDPVRMEWDARCAKTMVRIEREAMEHHLATLLDRPLRQPLRFDPVMRTDGRALTWWRHVGLLIDEIDALGAQPARSAAVRHLESLLLSAILEVQPHNYSDALNEGKACIAPRHVRQVERYIDEHAQEEIDLVTLVEASGVSARTLFEGFQRFRGTSPMAHLRAVRLERVREALLSGGEGRNVSDIATAWHFFELGRFAGLYRQRYGESPSQTLKGHCQAKSAVDIRHR